MRSWAGEHGRGCAVQRQGYDLDAGRRELRAALVRTLARLAEIELQAPDFRIFNLETERLKSLVHLTVLHSSMD